MSANVDAMVEAAIRAYRAGNKEEARALLFRVVDLDERHEQAWLWLSAVVEAPDDQRTCLENVLAINPNNDRAKQGLEVLLRKSTASKPPAEDLAGLTFSEPAARQQPAKPKAPDEELPVIDWSESGIETSSASATFRAPEPSAKEYDDWVSGLNLGGSPNAGIFGDDGSVKANAFGFDDDEDAKSAPKPAATSGTGAPAFVGPFEAEFDDFDLSLDDDDFIPPPQKPAASASAKPSGTLMSPPAPEQRKAQKQASPAKRNAEQDITSDLDEDYDEAEFNYQDQDLDELFMVIPNEIRPTRLPGTREGVPTVLVIGILLLLLLNIGAVILLVSQLSTQAVS